MSQNKSSGLSTGQTRVFYVLYLALSAVGLWHMRLSATAAFLGPTFEKIAKIDDWQLPDSKITLRRHYTGIKACDELLSFFVAAFLPAASGWNAGMKAQLGYFLLSFAPLVATWSVESVRTRNRWTVITFTTLWAMFYQTVGGAVIIPLYYLFYTYITSRDGYWARPSTVEPSWAAALAPALALGYIAPSIAISSKYDNIVTLQGVVAFWQIAPFLVNMLWLPFSYLSPKAKDSRSAVRRNELGYLNVVHVASALVSALAHWYLLALFITSDDPTLSLRFVFVPRIPTSPTFTTALHFIFQVDFLGIAATTTVACFQVMLELMALGQADFGPVTAVISIMVHTILLGPGATLGAVWWWREHCLASRDSSKKTT